VKVKAMRYEAAEGNTTNVTIGAGTNAFVGPLGATGTHVLKPGGVYQWSDPNGYTVTPGDRRPGAARQRGRGRGGRENHHHRHRRLTGAPPSTSE
jgi:hypothetical protein